MFMRQNNSKDNKPSVNTRGVQFFNNKSTICPSTLVVGYWNEHISIRINPALPKEKQTQSGVYDYKKLIATALNIEKACVLIDSIEKIIIPALKNGEEKSVGIPTSLSLISIYTKLNQSTGTVVPFLGLYKDFDTETMIASTSLSYEFNPTTLITNYNPSNGSFQKEDIYEGEFKAFLIVLKAAVEALSNSHAHSMRYVDKWKGDKTIGLLEDIGRKMGITSPYLTEKKSTDFGESVWDRGTSSKTTNSSQDIELENISSLDSFMLD